ncbi:UNVERIFIED_CONTAM: FlgN protein [Acetivibrio alkalicellulosi]
MEFHRMDSLFEILNQEALIYEDILKISRDKTDIIIKGKVNELENITKLEQSLIVKMGKLEILRESLIEEISQELDIKESNATVSLIAQHLDKDTSTKLYEYKSKMENLLAELKDINELNSKLLQNSIDYIDFSLNVLSSASESDNNYGHEGQISEGKKKTFFDVKL